ncbi:winged helix-turn-helix transcriptional regulator [Vibrio crassostreae]
MRGLSKAEICKLVGITPTRLRSQLSTLLREGYIINVIGGKR